jgi:hypothetical protein
MLRTIISSQRNRVLVAMTGRVQATRGTALFSTNATEVFDDAANREQLEQVSQQMEDAMQKEKQISQIPQVNGQTSSQMWDSNARTAKEPADGNVSQAGSSEMDQINKEQRQANKRTDMGDLKMQANPVGFQTEAATRDYYSHDKNYNVNSSNRNYSSDATSSSKNDTKSTNMPNIDPAKVMEQVKDMATGAAGLASGAVNMAAGVGHVVSETAKATMHNLQEMMPNAPSVNTTENSKWRKDSDPMHHQQQRRNSDGSLIEDATKMMRDTAKDLIDTMTHPTITDKVDEKWRQQQEQRDRQGTNTSGGATQAGEETQETSRGKQFSEHRQNASLL